MPLDTVMFPAYWWHLHVQAGLQGLMHDAISMSQVLQLPTHLQCGLANDCSHNLHMGCIDVADHESLARPDRKQLRSCDP